MKYSNRLRNFAVSALAIGCLGNYGISEAMQSYEDILKANTFEQKLNCKLAVKVKIDFKGEKKEFSLYDGNNVPQTNTIDFSVEGVKSPKIIMELADCYKFIDSGNVKVIKTSKNENIDENKAPQFNVKVTGPEGLDNAFEDDSTKILAYLLPSDESKEYHIVITPNAVEKNTILTEFLTGTIKFSIIGE